jgi:2-haloacid dehalogenase
VPVPRALLFDVFGTLVDWRGSLLDLATPLAEGADWPSLLDDWRRAYRPALDRVRAEPGWRDLDAVQRATLDDVLARHGIDLDARARDALVQGWHRLRPWPDVRGGLDRLRRGPVTATLSNGHVALLVELLRHGDLRVDAVLSAELAGSYKPDPVVYRRAAELLRCPLRDTAMVAAHADDLQAAAALGLRPVFVRRPAEWGPADGDSPPVGLDRLLVVDGLDGLADALGL